MREFRFGLVGALIFILGAFAAHAENYVDVGNYIIHYNALPTETMTPEVARAYGIQRSQSRVMINITVMKKNGGDGLNIPTEALVEASATNLTGQRREIDMRMISEQQYRYYIGVARVANEETVDFKIKVTPDGEVEPFEMSFRRKFFVDD